MGHHHDRARGDSQCHRGRREAPADRSTSGSCAARLYWGARPPSYPSLREMHTRPAPDRHLLRPRLPRPAAGPRRAEPLGPRRAPRRTRCATPRSRSARAATTALRHAGYHPGRFNRLMLFTEQCHAAVVGGAAARAAELDPLPVTRDGDPGPRARAQPGPRARLRRGLPAGRTTRRPRWHVPARGVRRQLGRDGPLEGLLLGAGAGPARLGGKIRDVAGSGTFRLADVQRSRSADQALRIRAGRTTYWVEYQPQHSPVIGRTIPGVMIRRQVDGGPVELVDASPGNPTGIAYPDGDLTNSALPVGQQPDHAGAHPDHHGRDRAARHGARRVRPDHRGPRRARRPVRCPGAVVVATRSAGTRRPTTGRSSSATG